MKRATPVLRGAALFLCSFALPGDTVTLPAVTSLLNPGAAAAVRTFTPTSAQVGTHSFTCSIVCGEGHPFDGAIEVVP